MPELAGKIVVRRDLGGVEITVDGEEFPWYTSGGVDVAVVRGESPAITVTIPAKCVVVEDSVEL